MEPQLRSASMVGQLSKSQLKFQPWESLMDILDGFSLRPLSRRLEDLETPTPIVDIDVVDRNLKRWQARCDEVGIANRPHVKTHKLSPLAKYQVAVGAAGITAQKLGETEVMADAGIRDI